MVGIIKTELAGMLARSGQKSQEQSCHKKHGVVCDKKFLHGHFCTMNVIITRHVLKAAAQVIRDKSQSPCSVRHWDNPEIKELFDEFVWPIFNTTMDRSSRWVSKSTRSLWREKVKRETEQCKNVKPVNLLVNESRGTGKGDFVVLKSDLAFVPWPPLALNVISYAQFIPDRGDRERHTVRVLLDDQTWRLYIRRQFLWVYRHQQGTWLVLSYLGVGESVLHQIGLNKAPCLQFSVRTHQHGCLSGCRVHDRTPRSPVQTPHTDCQPENAEYEQHLLGLLIIFQNPTSLKNLKKCVKGVSAVSKPLTWASATSTIGARPWPMWKRGMQSWIVLSKHSSSSQLQWIVLF